ncbi:DNA polymerase-3 subunit delta' [Raineyella antarctica]|uniref:DNA polymerase-3 subunit delta n=1 Tax=Raineyella antarctica TaxID=1577474 RepID=A0A1G6GD46_9ACTN|nr:DNA polymerase III subunit delta' [Raineyella antarctica]SDB79890.1 DNA polymerase-3 subunit delta' [Raineyella antarctica]
MNPNPGHVPTTPPADAGVWADLVGQRTAVEVLRRAVVGDPHAMSHAWLISGPPGSGRSNAARAFAAALQCDQGGCGHCRSCRTVLAGSHPDVTVISTEKLSIGVDEIRDVAVRSYMSPTVGRWQVVLVEDADRITERGVNALLKSIEEPSPATVWLLCAPTPDDVLPTIRSRTRALTLVTPAARDVARLLVQRDGISPHEADVAARAAQGHIGRARHLARDASARQRRDDVLKIPAHLTGVGACLRAAETVVKAAEAEATAQTSDLEASERTDLQQALGMGTKGARPRNVAAAVKELEDEQKLRVKRLQRDAIDRALTELTTWYRDVLSIQLETGAELVNIEHHEQVAAEAARATPDRTIARIDAILACREALASNVAPLLAVESMMVSLGADEPLA